MSEFSHDDMPEIVNATLTMRYITALDGQAFIEIEWQGTEEGTEPDEIIKAGMVSALLNHVEFMG